MQIHSTMSTGASNVAELDGETDGEDDSGEQTAAKQQLGVKHGESKILGSNWKKTRDTHLCCCKVN